jgi:putative ABC transport system ATP-binding protein/macrolide transport system ATP-binding/permease protein/lipoprotein-releasing system ATP-binding protein
MCRPTTGSVRLDETDVWSLPADRLAEYRNRSVGFVFQFASLLPALRAIDNVALPALVAGREGSEAVYARAETLLKRVGLGDRLEAYPAELSGGQQRRVALARALINEPPLILADEPTGDLDEEAEAEVFRLLLELHRDRGATLVVVTHNLDLAREADQVIHIRGGRALPAIVPESGKREVLAEQRVSTGEQKEPMAPKPGPARGGLGAGFGNFLLGVAAWAAVVVLAGSLMNYGVGRYQQAQVAEKKAARQELQEVALYRMRAEVDNLASGPDHSYFLTLYAQNLEPESSLFLMAPEVRAFIQVGLEWQEVPLRSEDNRQGRVVRITADRHRFRFRFTANVKGFEEVLPGYLHVRFSSAMLVSRSADPKGDLVERLDDYYVYLKPHDADDAAILRKTRFPGKPPLWIPMPPH